MWIQKCDICGEEKNTERFRYKVKVEKEYWNWGDSFWKKLDICDDCQEIIAKSIRQWKEDDLIRKERKEKTDESN